MKINKIIVILVFVAIFFLGIFLGFYIKDAQNSQNPIDLNPFPKSCQYNGKTYKPGESFLAEDGCNRCSCENGKVACTLMACQ
jgi:hypothetical protein